MKNIYLETLASIICSSDKISDKGVPITLSVKGVLISGELISKGTFFDDEGNSGLRSLRSRLLEVAEDHDLNDNNGVDPDHDFEPTLYLKNAKYFVGGGQIPTEGSALIAVDLNSVDAFNMGQFKQE
ncbi:hypothetical protein [Acinetobacter indicus]|uniref:hypothetical protein n=1 Tax=Acinetobacter indicus TaxID=756892 RepID=UPI00094913CD|nr:hypothetical protein [Acinetobacter indicus]MCO8087257.1 hypothetical protein [Acinetobacter indicus]